MAKIPAGANAARLLALLVKARADHPNGQFLYAADPDGRVYIWHPGLPQEPHQAPALDWALLMAEKAIKLLPPSTVFSRPDLEPGEASEFVLRV